MGDASSPPQGDTAMGFPERVRRRGRHRRVGRRASRRSPSATCRCWSRSACSSGCSAARSCTSAPSSTTTRYLARRRSPLELLGCFAMTETGHGSNVQALGTTATYDAGDRASSSITHARRRRAQGLHRQRRRATAAWRSCSPSSIVGGEAHGVHALARADPRRATATPLRRRPHRGLRRRSSASTASTTAGSGSTTCGCRARTCSTATPRSPTDGTYSSPIENPTRRFFTMLGTLVQGRVCVGGAGDQRDARSR